MTENVASILETWARRRPDEPALHSRALTLSWSELEGRAGAVARMLAARGIGVGSRVALAPPDAATAIVSLFGILKVGATVTPLNRRLTRADRQRVIGDLAPDLVLQESIGEKADFGACTVAGEEAAFILYTSGTTGEPKGIVLSHEAVNFGLDSWSSQVLNIGSDDVSLAPLSLAHSFGLFGAVLAPLSAGAKVVLLDRFTPQLALKAIARHKVTVFPGVATMFRAVLDSQEFARSHLSSLRYAISGAAPCPWPLCEDWRAATGTPIVRGYGMTELFRPISFSAPDPGPPDDTCGRPVAGVEVRVVNPDGTPAKSGTAGDLWIKSPARMTEYHNRPDATREVLDGDWFKTGDVAAISSDGLIRIIGRSRDLINRGGEKVAPLDVENALLRHPEVAEAVAFPVTHPTLGEDVAAAIVLKKGASLTKNKISSFARKHLAEFQLPRRFLFVDSLPAKSEGKINRAELSRILGLETPGKTVGSDPPSGRFAPTELEAELARLWASALEVEHVGLDDDFFSLGGDSLRAAEFFLEIERELGRRLPPGILFEAPTVRELAKYIASGAPQKCVVPIQRKGERPPFFCVHDITGQIHGFQKLAEHLGTDQPFFGIQCLGLDGNDVPFRHMDDMAAHYVAEIRRTQPEGPYYLGGLSFGGRVAHKMAQLLLDAGETVALLALIDTYSKVGRWRQGLYHWGRRLRKEISAKPVGELPAYFYFIAKWLTRRLSDPIRDRLFAAAWALYARANRPVPRFLRRPEMLNVLISREYRAAPFQGDAVLFCGQLMEGHHPDRHHGWRHLIKGNLEMRSIPGTHLEIMKEPYVRTLANELDDSLEQARARATTSVPRRHETTSG